jgi:hypothetical protein
MIESGKVRRLLTILLAAAFLLPLVAPFASAAGDESGLPACCRRLGRHHCIMSAAERRRMSIANEARAPRWASPAERCPHCPAVPAAWHPDLLARPVEGALPMGGLGAAAVGARAECAARIARERARHKRGPPLPA